MDDPRDAGLKSALMGGDAKLQAAKDKLAKLKAANGPSSDSSGVASAFSSLKASIAALHNMEKQMRAVAADVKKAREFVKAARAKGTISLPDTTSAINMLTDVVKASSSIAIASKGLL